MSWSSREIPLDTPSAALRSISICVVLLGLSAPAPLLLADVSPNATPEPATRPAEHPSTAQLQSWIIDLGNDDSEIREKVTQALMSLGREDLVRLRDAALLQKDLLPGQINALHDVVTQVFLATEPYTPLPNAFLGLRWPSPPMGDANSAGIAVYDRIPGFCAYRMLRPGDMIVKVQEQPLLDMHDLSQFTGFILAHQPGDTLHFDVLRAGSIIHVPIVLDAKPQDLGLGVDFHEWTAGRMKKVDEFWQTTFGGIDHDAVASTTQATHTSQP
ncbi:MAG: hypothetical protein M3O30_01265 [Planctomycetota bacterium]|nr:hypothetical protein [Planctomycetota bacterium]